MDLELHSWSIAPAEARAIQTAQADRVETTDRWGAIERVAGVDVGFPDRDAARAAVVVLDAATLEPCEQVVAERPATFPYIPGLLSFREIPVILDAFAKLAVRPDLVLCDGQGRAHPRRFGLACHLGMVLDAPTIGVAKSRLTGTHGSLAPERGARTPLLDGDEVIGMVLRTRAGVRPLFVSVGHRISLESAVEWVLRCTPRYRLPETTRRAHALASTPHPT
jgi:deoxyribonuclease V